MKTTKLVGALVALAIVGLSLGDALTGHGIKGNKNLNPIVVGDGSSSNSSSSSGSSSGSSSSNSGSSSSNNNKDKEEAYATGNFCAYSVYDDKGKLIKTEPGYESDCKPGESPCRKACVSLEK